MNDAQKRWNLTIPRAGRHFLPGYARHITQRCHKKDFILKFAMDRREWMSRLLEARNRYGVSVPDYTVTSNHIHLLVLDCGERETISRSKQFIAGRTAQAFNRRKKRKGAFWEDRYHAPAVETNQHLISRLTYIDLNMVREGKWTESVAVGNKGFLETVKAKLGARAKGRRVSGAENDFALREPQELFDGDLDD